MPAAFTGHASSSTFLLICRDMQTPLHMHHKVLSTSISIYRITGASLKRTTVNSISLLDIFLEQKNWLPYTLQAFPLSVPASAPGSKINRLSRIQAATVTAQVSSVVLPRYKEIPEHWLLPPATLAAVP